MPEHRSTRNIGGVFLIAAVGVSLCILMYLFRQPLICFFDGESCLRILFIGNSYTYVNDLPNLFSDLAWSGGHVVLADSAVQGGWRLLDHDNSSATIAKLQTGKWDEVVLQEQSQIPADRTNREAEMYPAARDLAAKIQAIGAVPLFYVTWGHQQGWPEDGLYNYTSMQNQLLIGYQNIADELDAPMAPVGPAWEKALERDPSLQLWQSDGSHPSLAGSYLAACVFYAVIFRQSPEGLAFPAGLDAATAAELQKAAADTVLIYSAQWNLN